MEERAVFLRPYRRPRIHGGAPKGKQNALVVYIKSAMEVLTYERYPRKANPKLFIGDLSPVALGILHVAMLALRVPIQTEAYIG